jgi:hypothetical protein
MWFVFGLPFVLRNLESAHGVIGIADARLTAERIPAIAQGGFTE